MGQPEYNWKERREKKALLALEDGTVFRGYSFGAEIDMEGEVVFNTGMSGYQEIITDPSYAGQFVTMTYPEIGNTGINSEDNESRSLFLNGFIINELNEASSWRNEISLKNFLKKNNIPAIAGIDTRALTTILRNKGTMKAFMHCSNASLSSEECLQKAQSWRGLDNQDYAAKVTCSDIYKWDSDNIPKPIHFSKLHMESPCPAILSAIAPRAKEEAMRRRKHSEDG